MYLFYCLCVHIYIYVIDKHIHPSIYLVVYLYFECSITLQNQKCNFVEVPLSKFTLIITHLYSLWFWRTCKSHCLPPLLVIEDSKYLSHADNNHIGWPIIVLPLSFIYRDNMQEILMSLWGPQQNKRKKWR